MKKKALNLDELKVTSFVTDNSAHSQEVIGGNTGFTCVYTAFRPGGPCLGQVTCHPGCIFP